MRACVVVRGHYLSMFKKSSHVPPTATAPLESMMAEAYLLSLKGKHELSLETQERQKL